MRRIARLLTVLVFAGMLHPMVGSPALKAQSSKNPGPGSGQEPDLSVWARQLLESASVDSSGSATVDAAVKRLWALYFLAVEQSERIDDASLLSDSLLNGSLPEHERGVVEGLTAALDVLRAKHSWWPPSRLGHLDAGLTALDSLVARRPEAPAERYLRLVSSYHLPFFLSRDETVREDFQALSDLLLAGPGATLPLPIFPAVVAFVLKHGDFDAETRARLEAVSKSVVSTNLRRTSHDPAH